jgi:hypothetical protein
VYRAQLSGAGKNIQKVVCNVAVKNPRSTTAAASHSFTVLAVVWLRNPYPDDADSLLFRSNGTMPVL